MDAAEGPQRSALVKNACSLVRRHQRCDRPHDCEHARIQQRHDANAARRIHHESRGSGVEERGDWSGGPGRRPKRAGATLRSLGRSCRSARSLGACQQQDGLARRLRRRS